MTGNLNVKLTLFVFIMFICTSFGQDDSKFKVVLDAGHGGKDYGAIYHKFIEKNIALSVVMKVGKILENDPTVDVVYTRKTDVFIELSERANIANRAKANIFVSIHCNGATNQSAYGTETFVMGTTKSASALEVAKKENAVIYQEKDYKIKYKGYDPNRPETVIGLNISIEENIDQSIILASKIEAGFKDKLNRKSRGVKAAGFLVLRDIYMPRILVELGFISNKTEGEFLNSAEGQDKLARNIADAILSYKKEYFIPVSNNSNQPVHNNTIEEPKQTVNNTPAPSAPSNTTSTSSASVSGVIYRVQIAASGTDLETTPSNFNGLSNVSKIQSAKLFKYYYGETGSYDTAKALQAEARDKGYPTAYVVPFLNGKVITMDEALKKR